jgi:hypothetical protein
MEILSFKNKDIEKQLENISQQLIESDVIYKDNYLKEPN